MNRLPKRTSLTIFLVLLGIVGAEIAAQAYVYYVAKLGKLFEPDPVLGWRPIPDIDMQRKNADGQLYRIRTDASSIRGPAAFIDDPEKKRILVIGDSFAFGEGVDLEDRFDARLSAMKPSLSIVNVGVPGYGTDQQLLRARIALDSLRRGDAVLLLFYVNDLHDVARTRHSGRSKPWYDLSERKLVLHPPEIGLIEWVRDKSYLLSVFATRFDTDPRYSARLPESLGIVRALIRHFSQTLEDRGISLWIAVHGLVRAEDPPFGRQSILTGVCAYATTCFDLDPVLSGADFFLSDGHWNRAGHRRIAEFLANRI